VPYRDPLTTRVGDICSTELALLGPDDDVDQAARLVRDRAVRRIPVVQDAIVSIGDLALEKDDHSPPLYQTEQHRTVPDGIVPN